MKLPLVEQPLGSAGQVDVRALEHDLCKSVEGEVRFDAASRAAYSTDASNYRRVPSAVVVPKTTDDVVAAVAACRQHGMPLVARGGGTSLDGQCVTHGLVLDCSKYLNKIIDVDPDARTARVQPGLVLDTLNKRTIPDHDLAYGPDPSTHSHCTFGGMLGNNSCGVHSILAGRTSDNVVSMEVLTSDGHRLTVGRTDPAEFDRRIAAGGREGELFARIRTLRDHYASQIRDRFPNIPRRVSGYNLPDLLEDNECNLARALVGSEGTLVTILEATIRLVRWPKKRALLVLGYPSVFEAGDHVPEIMEARPMGLEGLDDRLAEFMKLKHLHDQDIKLMPDGHGWLLVEFGGPTRKDAEDRARQLMDRLKQAKNPPQMELIDSEEREEKIWQVRESGLGATAFVPGMKDTWPGWEDAAVPPEHVGSYLRDFRALLDDFGYDCALYGHFGQGCIHCRINFDLVTPHGLDHYRAFVHRAAELCVRHGGSLSAEHGDALSKSELLPIMFGDEIMQAFKDFKAIWDPTNLFNPGKIVDAPSLIDDLRLGGDFEPRRMRTHFNYEDSGRSSFERASIRCVGVGKCRRRDDVFMCPSYQATQEEIHTTRGRARLLFEMTRGDFITDGWRSDAVRESLDLCLACKGCKKECPVSVDMATYKSEFLAHYYHARLRPRDFYAMGNIGLAARIASIAPRIANWFGSAPVVGPATKWLAGIAPSRDVPKFARHTFRHWFAQQPPTDNGYRGDVLLIPDAFNDHFFPESLQAATHVLESLGYVVRVPRRRYPAIRPLIHYGFLERARRHLRHVIDRLDELAQHEIPIVGLEPSTVAVIRDEANSFFPSDPAVRRVQQQTRLLSELLCDHHLDELPEVGGPCIWHAHCHEKAVLEASAARKVLEHMGCDVHEPEKGCCGMAGSFGFERSHVDLSRQIGEMNLFPAVRNAGTDTPIIIQGFSCREQIAQDTARRPVHFAEFVWDAMQRAGAATANQRHAAHYSATSSTSASGSQA